MKVEARDDGCSLTREHNEKQFPKSYFDRLPAEILKGLSVGDSIEIVLKGEVCSISQREDYSDKEKVFGEISMEYNDITVKKSGAKTEWDDMVEGE